MWKTGIMFLKKDLYVNVHSSLNLKKKTGKEKHKLRGKKNPA